LLAVPNLFTITNLLVFIDEQKLVVISAVILFVLSSRKNTYDVLECHYVKTCCNPVKRKYITYRRRTDLAIGNMHKMW